jgi:hypothetical protein
MSLPPHTPGAFRYRNPRPAQASIAWTRAQSPAVHPIIGARRLDQLLDSLGAAGLGLPPKHWRASKQPPESTSGFPLRSSQRPAPWVFAQPHSQAPSLTFNLLPGQGGVCGAWHVGLTWEKVAGCRSWTGGDPEVVAGAIPSNSNSSPMEPPSSSSPRCSPPAAPEVIGRQLPELHAAYETFAAAFKKRVEEGALAEAPHRLDRRAMPATTPAAVHAAGRPPEEPPHGTRP